MWINIPKYIDILVVQFTVSLHCGPHFSQIKGKILEVLLSTKDKILTAKYPKLNSLWADVCSYMNNCVGLFFSLHFSPLIPICSLPLWPLWPQTPWFIGPVPLHMIKFRKEPCCKVKRDKYRNLIRENELPMLVINYFNCSHAFCQVICLRTCLASILSWELKT